MSSHPQRSFRCPPEVWNRARDRAKAQQVTLTDLLVDVLDFYGAGRIDFPFEGGVVVRPDYALPPLPATIDEREPLAERDSGEGEPSAPEVVAELETSGNWADPGGRPAWRTTGCQIGLSGGQQCDCVVFEQQPQSPYRCGECGHVKGVHA